MFRKVFIAFAATWWTAIFGLAFMAYFVTRKCGEGLCDGLGRRLTLIPPFVRLILHSDRLWAGWHWGLVDLSVMWVSAGIGYLAIESTTPSMSPSAELVVGSVLPSPTSSTPAARRILSAEVEQKRALVAEAAACATESADVTLEPEEDGWSIRLHGEVIALIDSYAAGQEAVAYARSLIETRETNYDR